MWEEDARSCVRSQNLHVELSDAQLDPISSRKALNLLPDDAPAP
jgi:hypothetical protein